MRRSLYGCATEHEGDEVADGTVTVETQHWNARWKDLHPRLVQAPTPNGGIPSLVQRRPLNEWLMARVQIPA